MLFLIISSKSQNRLPFDVGNEVLHVTSSLDRGVNNAIQTIIYKQKVEKERPFIQKGKDGFWNCWIIITSWKNGEYI